MQEEKSDNKSPLSFLCDIELLANLLRGKEGHTHRLYVSSMLKILAEMEGYVYHKKHHRVISKYHLGRGWHRRIWAQCMFCRNIIPIKLSRKHMCKAELWTRGLRHV